MGLSDLFGGRTARQLASLSADVRKLTAAVERLEAVQRKDAEQLKKLRDGVAAAASQSGRAVDAADRLAADAKRASVQQREAERERSRILERLDATHRTDAKWRKIFNNQLSALVRHVCLPLEQLPAPQSLDVRRFRLRSQNEEDGILFALLGHAGWGGRRFVEIGSGKSGGNAAALARDCGWAGLMIELSETAVELARKKFAANPRVSVVAERITPANVNQLLATHGYGGDVDVLSIDIDSYDYWVLEALNVVSPRILILEYNALFGPDRRVTIPLDQPLASTPKGYHGASLAALTDLAGRKGYRLVTCENAGVNAFYLRADVAREVPSVTPTEAFKPLRSRTELDDEVERATDIYETIAASTLPLVDV